MMLTPQSWISFSIGPRGEVGRALVSVKSGSVKSSMIRDLKGVLEREQAEIGLFVTLEEPSAPMRLEASTAGVYHSELSGRDYGRIQILTIAELLEEHRRPALPLLVLPTWQRAERVEKKAAEQASCSGSRGVSGVRGGNVKARQGSWRVRVWVGYAVYPDR